MNQEKKSVFGTEKLTHIKIITRRPNNISAIEMTVINFNLNDQLMWYLHKNFYTGAIFFTLVSLPLV